MIIVRLIGGLGNQMFQYAAGRRAAWYNKTNLKLDISGFGTPQGTTKRDYSLHIFDISENFATKKEIERLKTTRQNFFVSILSLLNFNKNSYFKEKYFHFDPEMLKVPDNTYIEGYWQSPKYFKDVERIIRKEFEFKPRIDRNNLAILKKIKLTPSISIHFRRGDYIRDRKTHQFHGVCGPDYYLRAVKLLIGRISRPHFFLFSDDPGWVKKNFKLKYPAVYVSQARPERDYEVMRLMSNCQHNVIANSAFSWWGAWLNRNPDKIVITPKRWFRDRTINDRDLIPADWIRI